jgi:hypothetical protein
VAQDRIQRQALLNTAMKVRFSRDLNELGRRLVSNGLGCVPMTYAIVSLMNFEFQGIVMN